MITEDGAARLACHILHQAAQDCHDGNQEAKKFLLDPRTADTWGQLAGVEYEALKRWVGKGAKIPPRLRMYWRGDTKRPR